MGDFGIAKARQMDEMVMDSGLCFILDPARFISFSGKKQCLVFLLNVLICSDV